MVSLTNRNKAPLTAAHMVHFLLAANVAVEDRAVDEEASRMVATNSPMGTSLRYRAHRHSHYDLRPLSTQTKQTTSPMRLTMAGISGMGIDHHL
jgi:hypothetical protein